MPVAQCRPLPVPVERLDHRFPLTRARVKEPLPHLYFRPNSKRDTPQYNVLHIRPLMCFSFLQITHFPWTSYAPSVTRSHGPTFPCSSPSSSFLVRPVLGCFAVEWQSKSKPARCRRRKGAESCTPQQLMTKQAAREAAIPLTSLLCNLSI